MNWPKIAIILIATYAELARAGDQNDAPSSTAAERARIAAARQVVEQKQVADEATCYRQFAVNDCLSRARSQRREALADLRRQEVALNDTERRQAAAVRQQQLDEKASARLASGEAGESVRTQRVHRERTEPTNRSREEGKKVRQDPGPTLPGEAVNTTVRSRTAAADQRAADAAKRAQQARVRIQEARERQSSAEKRASGQGKPAIAPLATAP